MTPGQHFPPDPSRGDESTIGGYAAVHARPAGLAGRDGMSYSIEIITDVTGDRANPIGAYLLFVRWTRMGEHGVSGHLESDFLMFGETAAQAKQALGALPLHEAQRTLDTLITTREARGPARRWWDVMQQERGNE